MTIVKKIETGLRSEAHSWFESSLRQGFDLSDVVLAKHAVASGTFFALVPEDFARSRLDFAVGGVVRQESAQAGLSVLLEHFREDGAQCVIVEDDLVRRMDPAVYRRKEPMAFLGDRVIHWCDLTANIGEAVETIAGGASGYPLNGFVTTRSSMDLGLADRQQVPAGLSARVAESLVAVICSAFDAESFVVWDVRTPS